MMGRTMKRVPLDFAWPLKKTWGGYLNPFSSHVAKCPACDGSGYSPEAKRFSDQWYGKADFDPKAYGARQIEAHDPEVLAVAKRHVEHTPEYYGTGQSAINREAVRLWYLWKNQWSHHLIQADVDALVKAERLWDFTRRQMNDDQETHENGWTKKPNGHHPTAEEVNAWSLGGFGHRAINQWECVKARCEREGVEVTCRQCKGDGDMWPSGKIKRQHERWKPTEPPRGEGYQLWETTSEGSPISPVFPTIEALCEYAARHCSTFGTSNFVTAEAWREMLDEDFVVHREGNSIFM